MNLSPRSYLAGALMLGMFLPGSPIRAERDYGAFARAQAFFRQQAQAKIAEGIRELERHTEAARLVLDRTGKQLSCPYRYRDGELAAARAAQAEEREELSSRVLQLQDYLQEEILAPGAADRLPDGEVLARFEDRVSEAQRLFARALRLHSEVQGAVRSSRAEPKALRRTSPPPYDVF